MGTFFFFWRGISFRQSSRADVVTRMTLQVPVLCGSAENAEKALAGVYAFIDRTGSLVWDLCGQDGFREQVQLANLSDVRAKPFRWMNNLVLESIEEAESELSVLWSKEPSSLICCSVPQEYNPMVDRLEIVLQRLTRFNPVVVYGSGWGCSKDPGEQDNVVELQRHLTERFLRDLQVQVRSSTRRAGFIGDICLARLGPVEHHVLQAASDACDQAHKVNPQLGAIPVFVSLDEMLAATSNMEQRARFDQICNVFTSICRVFSSKSVLIIGGLLASLPGLHCLDTCAELDKLVNRCVKLVQDTDATLLVTAPEPERVHVVTFAIAKLCQHGLAERLILGSGVRFKSDLKRYGGQGYSFEWAQSLLLHRIGPDSLSKLTGANLLQCLCWFEELEAPKKAPKPRWLCDGPCGKTYPAKLEPFTRLEFKYCSSTCMHKHRQKMDDEEGNDSGGRTDDRNDKGGSRRANPTSSWGIAVGSS